MSKQKESAAVASDVIDVIGQGQTSLGLLAHWSALPSREGAGFITTMDLRKPGAAIQLQAALAGDSVSMWDLREGDVIEIEHLIGHYSETTDDETGEVRAGPMITLVGPHGTYHTSSQFAFRALQLIAMLRGAPPWSPPLKLRAVKCKSRKGRQYQSVLMVE